MAEGRLTAVKWLAAESLVMAGKYLMAESRVMTRNALWPGDGSRRDHAS